jgi:hypothetical protein
MPLIRTLLLALVALAAAPAGYADNIVGAATCGNSQCHQASKPRAFSLVEQTEFYAWLDSPHAKSQAVLKSARAQAIATRYGVSTSSKSCLGCHAFEQHHVVKSKNITEGITCEACHGNATSWLPKHVSGMSSHKKNLEHGMRKLEQPSVRAEVCSDCHQARGNPRMPHTLYAAGHPVLSFELVEASANTASHYRVDEDYLVRKGHPQHAEMWRAGQLNAATLQLQGLKSTLQNHDAMLPELSLFECASCHHQMAGQTNRGSLPSLAVGQLQMAALSIAVEQKVLSKKLLADIDALAITAKREPLKADKLAAKLAVSFARVRDQYSDKRIDSEGVAACLLTFAETETIGTDWLQLLLQALDTLSTVSHAESPATAPRLGRIIAPYSAQLNPRAPQQQATQLVAQLAAEIRSKWLLKPCAL